MHDIELHPTARIWWCWLEYRSFQCIWLILLSLKRNAIMEPRQCHFSHALSLSFEPGIEQKSPLWAASSAFLSFLFRNLCRGWDPRSSVYMHTLLLLGCYMSFGVKLSHFCCFLECNRNRGCRLLYNASPRFWVEYCIHITPTVGSW